MCIQSLYNAGRARNSSPEKGYELYDIRFDTTLPLQSCTLLFLCPITSIFLGIGRLKNVWQVKPDQPDSCLRKTYYTLTGIIATLGLGFVISVIRIVLTVIATLAYLLGYVIIKIFGNSNDDIKQQPTCVQKVLMPLGLILGLIPSRR